MTDNSTDRWCILRTSGGRTLPLAASLAEAGYAVWTPIATTRQSVRRGPTRVVIERSAPIAPTLVFGAADQLAEFARIRLAPSSEHPPFSIFQWDGRVPIVGERAVVGLRQAEAEALAAIEEAREAVARSERQRQRADAMRTVQQRRKALRAVHRTFAVGDRVSVTDAPMLAGLGGTVVESQGTSAVVAFGGSLTMTIEAWQIIPADVSGGN